MASYCESRLGNEASAEEYLNQIIKYSVKRWNTSGDALNTHIAGSVLKLKGKQDVLVRHQQLLMLLLMHFGKVVIKSKTLKCR